MVHKTQDYWVFGLCSLFIIPKNTFQKLDMFVLWRGRWEIPSLLGPLQLILTYTLQWLRSAFLTDPIGKMSSVPSPEGGDRSSFTNVVFFGIFMMNEIQKPSNPVESLLFVRLISCRERIHSIKSWISWTLKYILVSLQSKYIMDLNKPPTRPLTLTPLLESVTTIIHTLMLRCPTLENINFYTIGES